MLLQQDKEGALKLVYAISRRTTEPESRYHSSKLELLVVVWAVGRLRSLLANIPFTVVTDCQALCYLNTQKSLNPQVIRWHDLLSEYEYNITHRPGVKMAHVDAMSRAPVDARATIDDLGIFQVSSELDLVKMYQCTDERLKEKIRILKKPPNERTAYE